jgi:hypothetical protein
MLKREENLSVQVLFSQLADLVPFFFRVDRSLNYVFKKKETFLASSYFYAAYTVHHLQTDVLHYIPKVLCIASTSVLNTE